MSQIFKSATSAPPPPQVPTTFVTDVNSPSVPIANIENVLGGSTSANNNNGVRTDGSSGSNTLTVQLTNRVQGQLTTNDAVVHNIISFPMGSTPGTYVLDGTICAFDITDTAGAGYFFIAACRTTGVAGVEIGNQFTDAFDENSLSTANVDADVVGNNIVITVQGIAGKTIDWDAYFTYRFVG